MKSISEINLEESLSYVKHRILLRPMRIDPQSQSTKVCRKWGNVGIGKGP